MITRIEVSTPDIGNTYLDIDPETKHGFLIDPGAEPNRIIDAIRPGGFTIEKILLTHGHFDHIGAIDAVREAFGHPPVYIHEAGLRYLSSTFFNLSGPMGRPFTVEGAIPFQDGAVFSLQSNPGVSLRAIHVPGHSEDSTLLYSESGGYAFSGDTVFHGAVGATHFPGGDDAKLASSIRDRVLTLPPETRFYPGHGEPTVLSREIPLLRRVAGLSEIP